MMIASTVRTRNAVDAKNIAATRRWRMRETRVRAAAPADDLRTTALTTGGSTEAGGIMMSQSTQRSPSVSHSKTTPEYKVQAYPIARYSDTGDGSTGCSRRHNHHRPPTTINVLTPARTSERGDSERRASTTDAPVRTAAASNQGSERDTDWDFTLLRGWVEFDARLSVRPRTLRARDQTTRVIR